MLMWIWNGAVTLENKQFFKGWNTESPYDPAVPLLGGMKWNKSMKRKRKENVCPHKHSALSIAELFVIARKWKAKCLSTVALTDTMWYIDTMEQYLAWKRNDLSSHEKAWRKLECTLLSERSPPEKATYCMIPTLRHSEEGKTMETVKRSVITRGWVWER